MSKRPFYLNRNIVKSEAFRTLSQIAILVYLDFRMRCKPKKIKAKRGREDGWIILNNGEIEYTYTEAEAKGISRPRFKRALKDLVEKGFIDVSHSGMGGPKGDKSKYAISERWREWGTDKFIQKTMEKDSRKGRGFAVVWNDPHKRQALLDKKKKIHIGNDNITPPSNKNITPLKDTEGNEVSQTLLH